MHTQQVTNLGASLFQGDTNHGVNPCTGIPVLLHPGKPGQGWDVALGRRTPRGSCSSACCSLLEHCSAVLLPQIFSEHFIPSSTCLLEIHSL